MDLRSLIPFGSGGDVRGQPYADPFTAMQRDMNRMFDSMMRRPGPFAAGEANGPLSPDVDVKENKKAIEVSAELPGVEEKDIDVTFADGVLTIRGEKRSESTTKGDEDEGDYRLVERSYGSFMRRMNVPVDVDANKVTASFKNGVLHVKLPKKASEKSKVKKISIS